MEMFQLSNAPYGSRSINNVRLNVSAGEYLTVITGHNHITLMCFNVNSASDLWYTMCPGPELR